MEYQFDTKCVHGKKEEQEIHSFGSLTTPIFQSATFSHPGVGQSTGYFYSRESNPTRRELENTMSELEGAAETVACTSGMAALTLAMSFVEPGSHVICTDDLYGGSVRYFEDLTATQNMEFSYVDTSDVTTVLAAIKDNTKAIYIETPSNPMMHIADIEKISEIAKKHGCLVIVDNTFLTPYLQNPLKLGADIVIHSGTKFLGGHNDTLAGFVCVKDPELGPKLKKTMMTVGNNLSPFDSFLLIRGIKTLALRVERQQESAKKIADWLETQEKVKKVYYVGKEDHPGYEINKKQARGAGSMISFRVDSAETAKKILENVKLLTYAESLGGVESLITYPMLQTHADVPVEVREKLGITEDFLRLSVGIENVDDIIADLAQAIRSDLRIQ